MKVSFLFAFVKAATLSVILFCLYVGASFEAYAVSEACAEDSSCSQPPPLEAPPIQIEVQNEKPKPGNNTFTALEIIVGAFIIVVIVFIFIITKDSNTGINEVLKELRKHSEKGKAPSSDHRANLCDTTKVSEQGYQHGHSQLINTITQSLQNNNTASQQQIVNKNNNENKKIITRLILKVIHANSENISADKLCHIIEQNLSTLSEPFGTSAAYDCTLTAKQTSQNWYYLLYLFTPTEASDIQEGLLFIAPGVTRSEQVALYFEGGTGTQKIAKVEKPAEVVFRNGAILEISHKGKIET